MCHKKLCLSIIHTTAKGPFLFVIHSINEEFMCGVMELILWANNFHLGDVIMYGIIL